MPATATLAEVVRDAIGRTTRALFEADPHLRRDEDPEWVHSSRVAVRRLRSDLRVFASFFDPVWVRETRAELRWLADLLAPVRDADVLLAHIASLACRLPAQDRAQTGVMCAGIAAARAEAQRRLRAAMDEPRYTALLARLTAAAHTPALVPEAGSGAVTVLIDEVRRAWRRVKKTTRKLGSNPSDDELHVLRIRAKRFRYGLEAVAPVLRARSGRFQRRLVELQDLLGELHDAVVERQRLRASAAGGPTAFVAGELARLETETRDRARRRWRRAWQITARAGRRFWRRWRAE